jgi:hypothetical protein
MSKATSVRKNKTSRKRNKPVEFFVSKIVLIDHSIDIPHGFDVTDFKSFRYRFGSEITFDLESKHIQILIRYEFFSKEHSVFRMEVLNEYKINNYDDAVFDNKFVNKNYGLYIVELSINHARGIQAQLTKDEVISSLLIPFVPETTILDRLQ